MTDLKYDVVHIVTSAEYKAPLVAVQVFDRAQFQATVSGNNKPASVSVWIMAPMRELFQKDSQEIVRKLKARCPNVNITMVGGIGRLKDWPSVPTMKKLRRALKNRVVYHCRGESSQEWAYIMKQKYRADAIVLDIRGFLPLERFVNKEIFNVSDLSPDQKKSYDSYVAYLAKTITNSEMVCTVSEPLRQHLIKYAGANENTVLIPCCVSAMVADTNREKIRKELNIGDKTAVLYLGGTQRYQHLEDLVIPFIKSAMSSSDDCVGIFITQNKDKMLTLIRQFGLDENKIRLISVGQTEVADYLTAMDIGLLLRSPNDLNSFSQPVKFGEYLSAGIPVVIEEGTGDIARMLSEYQIGCVVKLSDKQDQKDFDKEVKTAIEWNKANRHTARANARKFVAENYTWTVNVQKERKMYFDALQKASVK